jgi:hypothetical protein
VVRPKSQVVQLDEEFFKWGQEYLGNIDGPLVQAETNFHALCGSLIERYNRNELSIHLHLSANDGERPELCIAVEHGRRAGTNAVPDLPVFHGEILSLGKTSHEVCQKYPSVFVDIRQVIQSPEDMLVEVLPQVVRLQTFDLCNRVYGNPIKTVPPDLVFERFRSTTDGEHIFFSGLTARSKHKFPHKIIEGGAEVLKAVSNNQTETRRNGATRNESKNSLIIGSIGLLHHFAGIALKVPIEFGAQRLDVLCGPEDFTLKGL